MSVLAAWRSHERPKGREVRGKDCASDGLAREISAKTARMRGRSYSSSTCSRDVLYLCMKTLRERTSSWDLWSLEKAKAITCVLAWFEDEDERRPLRDTHLCIVPLSLTVIDRMLDPYGLTSEGCCSHSLRSAARRLLSWTRKLL